MEINRNNYEIFFLDYLDRKLSGNQIDHFLDFLELNPDLKEELITVSEMTIPSEEMHYAHKASLYKTERDRSQDQQYIAVAFMEGDLDEEENDRFLKHLELHPEQNRELELLMKTRLHADETLLFSNKNRLYRKTPIKRFIYWGSRIAAILILAFSFWSVFNFEKKEPAALVAKQSEPVSVETVIHAPVSKTEIQAIKTIESKETHQSSNYIAPQNIQPVVMIEREKEILATIEPKTASVTTYPIYTGIIVVEQVQLAQKTPSSEYYTLDQYFVEKVLKIEKKQADRRNPLLEKGLEFASNISGKRFNYQKNDGKVSRLSYDSRLLAISLPVGN